MMMMEGERMTGYFLYMLIAVDDDDGRREDALLFFIQVACG